MQITKTFFVYFTKTWIRHFNYRKLKILKVKATQTKQTGNQRYSTLEYKINCSLAFQVIIVLISIEIKNYE